MRRTIVRRSHSPLRLGGVGATAGLGHLSWPGLGRQGRASQLPLPGGQGKAIHSMPAATQVPIYVASLDPRVLEITGELADGWIGSTFMREHADVFTGRLRADAAAMPSGPATTAANSSS
jgi:hypothetical protein